MNQELFDALKQIILEKTAIEEDGGARRQRGFFADPALIKPDTSLAELGLDSLAVTAVAAAVEDRFAIELSPMLTFEIFTVGDFVERIATQIAQKGGAT